MTRWKIEGHETWQFFRHSEYVDHLFDQRGPHDWKTIRDDWNDQVSSVRRVGGEYRYCLALIIIDYPPFPKNQKIILDKNAVFTSLNKNCS